MNLTLHLPPDTEARLIAQAQVTGKDAETLALEALSEKLGSVDSPPMLPSDEWHARLNALVASMPRGNTDADFSRDSIYDGRGE